MNIKLSEIMNIDDPSQFKVHLATWNGNTHPLDVFVKSKEEWKGWNSHRGTNDDFNREFIFSLVEYYHEPDTWLFGGIYRVVTRLTQSRGRGYEVELSDMFQPFIGRLKLTWKRAGRAKARLFENYINEFEVSELLRQEYAGEAFCGYEKINHSFSFLEGVFKSRRVDWRAALENVKGVYLIIDKANGKKYVGSAYGEAGIYSRWSSYLDNGHGHNDELVKLIKTKGKDYARTNFRFSLLEHRSMKTDDSEIIAREVYWKDVLLSREYGYNKN